MKKISKTMLMLAIVTALNGSVCRTVLAIELQLDWVKRSNGLGYDQPNAISVDGSGNSFVTGFFGQSSTQPTVFGPGETNQIGLTSAGAGDIYLAKYNPTGALAWAKRAGGTPFDQGYSVVTDTDGNVYVVGSFGGTATFGQGEPNEISFTSVGGQDIFIAKYDSNGSFVWAKQAGGDGVDEAYGVALDGSNNVYVTGMFGLFGTTGATFAPGEVNETVLNHAGGGDIFVAKYDSDGALIWVTQAAGVNTEYARTISTDSLGNSYIAGLFVGTSTFGSGEINETQLVSTADNDIFVAKYDSSGTLVWAKQAGGTGSEFAYRMVANALGDSYVVGYFNASGLSNGSATFGKGEPNETTLTGTTANAFIVKYGSNGALQWAKQATGFVSNMRGLALDGLDNGYVTGTFSGTVAFGSGEPHQTTLIGSNSTGDGFVAKYDVNGALVWAAKITNSSAVQELSLGIDNAGNSYVTGGFFGTVTFGFGQPNQTTFTATQTNAGNIDIFTVRLSEDKISPSIAITSPANNAIYKFRENVTASYACTDSGTGVATCVGTVPNGNLIDTSSAGTKTFTVTSADNAGNPAAQTTTYSVVQGGGGGGGGSATADLAITLSAPAKIAAGQTLTYLITVKNLGAITATNVVVTDALPSGTVFASASTSQGTISAPAIGVNGTVTVNLGSLVNSATATISLVTSVTATSGTLTNTATVSAVTQDSKLANNSETKKTNVR